MHQFISNVSVVPSSLWIGLTIGVFVLLIIDLSLFGKGGHKMNTKSALLESGLWMSVALVFNAWFAMNYGNIESYFSYQFKNGAP